MHSDLGVCLPLLSAGDLGLPVVRGLSAAQLGHKEGTAGEDERGSGVAAMGTRSGDE
jgi:hypothetical protein